MVYNCYLCKRKASKVDRISLHKFPRRPMYRNKWLEACNLSPSDYLESMMICSLHFHPDDINKGNEFQFRTTYLNTNAVPSIGVPIIECRSNISYENTLNNAGDDIPNKNTIDNKNKEISELAMINTYERINELNDLTVNDNSKQLARNKTHKNLTKLKSNAVLLISVPDKVSNCNNGNKNTLNGDTLSKDILNKNTLGSTNKNIQDINELARTNTPKNLTQLKSNAVLLISVPDKVSNSNNGNKNTLNSAALSKNILNKNIEEIRELARSNTYENVTKLKSNAVLLISVPDTVFNSNNRNETTLNSAALSMDIQNKNTVDNKNKNFEEIRKLARANAHTNLTKLKSNTVPLIGVANKVSNSNNGNKNTVNSADLSNDILNKYTLNNKNEKINEFGRTDPYKNANEIIDLTANVNSDVVNNVFEGKHFQEIELIGEFHTPSRGNKFPPEQYNFSKQSHVDILNCYANNKEDQNFERLKDSCLTTSKRRVSEPRYVSEIQPSDFGSPRRIRIVLNLIRETDKKKSKLIKALRERNRKLEKRICSLKDIVKNLKTKKTTETALMNKINMDHPYFKKK